jgi:hypothetical protein
VAQGFKVYKALYPPIETYILKASNVFFGDHGLIKLAHCTRTKKLGKHPPSNGLKYQYTTIKSMLSTWETT